MGRLSEIYNLLNNDWSSTKHHQYSYIDSKKAKHELSKIKQQNK